MTKVLTMLDYLKKKNSFVIAIFFKSPFNGSKKKGKKTKVHRVKSITCSHMFRNVSDNKRIHLTVTFKTGEKKSD